MIMMFQKIIVFLKKDTVLTAAMILAAVSCFRIPPDGEYLGYIDFDTLILLLCLMLIMEGLKELKFFRYVGRKVLERVRTARGIILTLVFLCFISSMLITNDVALITFVPFGLLILEMTGLTNGVCFTITLMTIAANLGSMLTPVGNPQNLYLFSISGMELEEFMLLMLPYTLLAAVLLFICVCVGGKRGEITFTLEDMQFPVSRQFYTYLILFVLCLLSVAGIIPKPVLLPLVAAGIFLIDKRLFRRADYTLLLTFVCFFVFVGNMNRMESLRVFISGIIENRERLVAVGLSQIISNVPAAVLLSGYTENIKELLVGTNLGGLGTLIASMASLISYKQVAGMFPEQKKKYLIVFTVWNIVFLAVLLASGKIFGL